MIRQKAVMNKFFLVTTAILPMIFCAAPTHAQDVDCTDPQDQTSMNICAYRDWEAADRELNAVWPFIRNRLRESDSFQPEELKGGEEALLRSQRAWIEYRDGTCEAEGFQARGGTLETFIVSSCLARLTRHRTKELQEIAPQY